MPSSLRCERCVCYGCETGAYETERYDRKRMQIYSRTAANTRLHAFTFNLLCGPGFLCSFCCLIFVCVLSLFLSLFLFSGEFSKNHYPAHLRSVTFLGRIWRIYFRIWLCLSGFLFLYESSKPCFSSLFLDTSVGRIPVIGLEYVRKNLEWQKCNRRKNICDRFRGKHCCAQ